MDFMLVRVAQRTPQDCAIAVLATVMGPPYTYERVLADTEGYPKVNDDGTYPDWCREYLTDSNFHSEYRPLTDVNGLAGNPSVVGILRLAPVAGRIGHIVAIDECGIINPSTGWPERITSFRDLLSDYIRLGTVYVPQTEFLAVWLPQTPP